MKKIWKCINTFTKKTPKKGSCLPEKLMSNNGSSFEITNPQSIADHLNKHFVEKGPKLASKLSTSNTSILEGMGASPPQLE